jgi:hypothetical protein
MDAEFHKFLQFTKVEETADGKVLVWGIATYQEPDLDQECCDYAAAVPVYKKWSDDAIARTKKAGQALSLGNIRRQHSLEPAGKATKIKYDDDEKQILLGSVPINDTIHDELKEGFLTGYSQGGSYAWRKCSDCGKSLTLQQATNYCSDCKKNVVVNYGLKRLSEVSYVDSPCTGQGFLYVKANGSSEIVKFAQRSSDMQLTAAQIEEIATAVANKGAKTKRVAGKDLHASDFAYVGDPDDTSTWKLPIHDASHCRNALARFNQTEGIPEGEKAKVKAKIVAAAKRFGVEVSEEGETKAYQDFMAAINKAVEAKGLSKGLYEVSELARLLSNFAFTYQNAVFERDMEGDDSDVPDELKELLEGMVETFIHMAEEEARELAATVDSSKAAKPQPEGGSMTPEEKVAAEQAAATAELAKKKGIASHFAKSAAHHEKMAAHHEKMADHHATMCDACKADVGEKADKADVQSKDEPHAGVANAPYYKAAGAHHKGMASMHEKCSKSHAAMADHCHGMAEGYDAEEHSKVSKAIKDADAVEAAKEPTPVVKAAPPTLDADVAAQVEVHRASPEYKQAISDIAKRKVEEEVAALREKTLAPDGVHLAAAATGTDGIRIVKRDGGTDPFKFASHESTVSNAGI